METLDSNGKQISHGLLVKYTRTHTVGRVDKIISKNGDYWVKIDTSGLYYKTDYIEVIEGNEIYINRNKPNKSKHKSEQFKIKIPVEISDTTDGPGVGGG